MFVGHFDGDIYESVPGRQVLLFCTRRGNKKKMCVSDHPTDADRLRFYCCATQSFFIEDHIEKKWSKSHHFERSYEVLKTKFSKISAKMDNFLFLKRNLLTYRLGNKLCFGPIYGCIDVLIYLYSIFFSDLHVYTRLCIDVLISLWLLLYYLGLCIYYCVSIFPRYIMSYISGYILMSWYFYVSIFFRYIASFIPCCILLSIYIYWFLIDSYNICSYFPQVHSKLYPRWTNWSQVLLQSILRCNVKDSTEDSTRVAQRRLNQCIYLQICT